MREKKINNHQMFRRKCCTSSKHHEDVRKYIVSLSYVWIEKDEERVEERKMEDTINAERNMFKIQK